MYHKHISIKKPSNQQSGVVLVLVVLAVALMATLMAFMIEDQHIFIRKVANQRVAEQGFQYANGMNAWASRILSQDSNPTVDYLDEDWALFGRPEEELDEDEDGFSLTPASAEEEEDEPTINFGIDGVTGVINDLQGKFNLNNLANEDREFVASQRRILQNLFEVLEIQGDVSLEQLVENLIDWVDENSTSRSIGLESNDYRVKDLPYQASDQKLAALGELRFVDGFNQDIIKAIEPHVTVLPVDNARININTTSPEVLASLSSVTVVDTASVEAFLAQRLDEAFLGFQAAQIQEAEDAIIGVSPVRQSPIANMMQVTSQYFEIESRVELGDTVYCLNSLVLRGGAAAGASLVAQGQSSGQQTEDISDVPAISVLRREHSSFCEDHTEIVNEENNEDFSET